MGEVVSRNATTDTIIDQAQKARTSATSRGGRVNELATARLDDALGIYTMIKGRLTEARTAFEPLKATETVSDDTADKTVGRVSDEIWNAIGRPAADPGYSLIFPEGIRTYVASSVDEEPDMLELLVELIGLPVLPRLTAEQRAEWQRQITDTIAPLRTAVDARIAMSRRIKLYERVERALGKVVQMRLVSFKRDLKSEGMTEAQIHAIIPDASKPRPATATTTTTTEPTRDV